MISFESPLYFILFIPLVLILYFKSRKKVSLGVGFSEIEVLKEVAGKNTISKLPFYLQVISIALVIVTLSGPVKKNGYEENRASGVDIILAVDVSPSMDALDFSTSSREQTRLEAVKTVVNKFIEERPFDRIGIVAFSGRPYLASPLTLDHNWVTTRIETLETGMIDGKTAIGSAIASSVNHLKDIDSKSKIVVLLTDGESNAGNIEPIQAARAAEALGVKIYTIGAGTEGKAPYRSNGFFSKYDYLDVNIDEEMLSEVANLTGGLYYRATDIDSLETIYSKIDEMEVTKRVADISVSYKYYYIIPLTLALFIYLLSVLLSLTILRKTF